MQEWTKIVGAAFQLSVALLVLAVGLRATWSDAIYLFRQPRLLLRSIISRNVIVPAMTLLLVDAMKLDPPVAAALLALSICAVPPILSGALLKSGGREQYALGLLTSQSILAVVIIPLSLVAINAVLGLHGYFAPRQVAPIIAKLTLLPLALGMLFNHLLPRHSARVARVAHAAGGIIILVALVAIMVMFFKTWMTLMGDGTLLAMILFVFIGLAAGHVIGGPRGDDRKSLAIASASSHPGLALALIAGSAAPQNREPAFAAVFLYLIVQAIVTIPYKRRQPGAAPDTLYRTGDDRRSRKRAGRNRRSATV
jgi:BASS family bile acid:Na+ symporter